MRLVMGLGFASLVGALMLGSPSSLWAGSLQLEAEVMESSEGMVVPGVTSTQVRSAFIHHQNEPDQATFAEWLLSHQSGSVRFVMSDGSTHQGMLHRLKHCFGRGLLLYADGAQLTEKAVIRLELPVAP